MLLPVDIDPDLTIYYKASLVLNELQKEPKQNMLDLYQKVKEKMRFPVFILCLDWLYLIDIAQIDGNGLVFLCF